MLAAVAAEQRARLIADFGTRFDAATAADHAPFVYAPNGGERVQ